MENLDTYNWRTRQSWLCRRWLVLGLAAALTWGTGQGRAQLVLTPGIDYSKPNYAYSPPIQKFVNALPGLGTGARVPGTALGANELGQGIPVAVANTPYQVTPGVDPYPGDAYYEIGLVEYSEQMHPDLAGPTKLRGYVQIVPSSFPGAVPLNPANGCSMAVTNGAGQQMYGLGRPQYLGPLILAQRNQAVRVKFYNLLPIGAQGKLFLPVDTTILGAGNGPVQIGGTAANPVYAQFTDNRATLHLHGGFPAWISDGTAHQWTAPAGEGQFPEYKKGPSARDVSDMGPSQDGVLTFHWPNQMSGRLMFYHEHAWGITGIGAYGGAAAGYLLYDAAEENDLAAAGVPGTIGTTPDLEHLIPMVIQDKTFVPSLADITAQDPNWLTDIKDGMTGAAPTEGNLWYPHVYIPNQWPGNPDNTGANPLGRWDWGPWFWPPWPVPAGVTPPRVSHTPEGFMDTMLVNGHPYPYLNVNPEKYRLRILNACNDRHVNLQLYKATPGIVSNIALSGGVAAIALISGGSDYDPLAPPPLVTITPAPGDTTGAGASATAIVDGTTGSLTFGQVIGFTVDVAGSGYTLDPIVQIAAPPVSTGATATASAIRIQSSGYDPLNPPFVTISGGGGRGAVATAVVDPSGTVSAVIVDIPGSGYTTQPTVAIDPPLAGGTPATAIAQIYTQPTEVGMVPASLTTGIAFPANWRIQTPGMIPDVLDGRVGGVPDPTNRGPAMIQIGTEGGLLPGPAVQLNCPIGYEQNKKNIVVLNTKEKTVFLTPAERADVVVDFSKFAGQTIILYNDAPAPLPASDPRCDLYTGDADQTGSGGPPSTVPGMGPSTRNIMVFRVGPATQAGQDSTSPPDYVDPTLMAKLTNTTTGLPALFAKYQPAPVVPESFYNAAYPTQPSPDTFSHIQDTQLSFTPYGSTTPTTMHMQPKTIQELFDDVGRLNATLGTEIPFTTAQIQTTVPLNFVDPVTEIFADGDTQIWKITHNGVDTHGVHFHQFNVQVINRVGWDGQISPPEPNERGWKETVRMNPLEDIIVAMRANKPVLPTSIKVPDSVRSLNPSAPLGSLLGFSNLDPLTGNANVPAVSNIVDNFGWEYTWHCHILGHEENDMMRATTMLVLPLDPGPLSAALNTTGPGIVLTWTAQVPSQTFRVQRATGTGAFATIATLGLGVTTYTDTALAAVTTYRYQVVAFNKAGSSLPSNVATITTPAALTSPPTGTKAVASALSVNPPRITVTWNDTPGVPETGFRISRALDANFTLGVTNFTVAASVRTFTDTTVAPKTRYYYWVQEFNPVGYNPTTRTAGTTANATTAGQLPATPTGLTVTLPPAGNTSLVVSWTAGPPPGGPVTGYDIQRSPNGNNQWTTIANNTTVNPFTNTGLTRNTLYYYHVRAVNADGTSAYTAAVSLRTRP